MIIFPEGTRVPLGERRRFARASPASTARSACRWCRSRVDSGRIWGRGLVKQRGTVHFKVGEVDSGRA